MVFATVVVGKQPPLPPSTDLGDGSVTKDCPCSTCNTMEVEVDGPTTQQLPIATSSRVSTPKTELQPVWYVAQPPSGSTASRQSLGSRNGSVQANSTTDIASLRLTVRLRLGIAQDVGPESGSTTSSRALTRAAGCAYPVREVITSRRCSVSPPRSTTSCSPPKTTVVPSAAENVYQMKTTSLLTTPTTTGKSEVSSVRPATMASATSTTTPNCSVKQPITSRHTGLPLARFCYSGQPHGGCGLDSRPCFLKAVVAQRRSAVDGRRLRVRFPSSP